MARTVKRIQGFTYTRAIKKLRRLKKRIRVVPGGTSAGKTYGILPILIDQACKVPGLEISVVSESVPHLRKGALKDFLKIMKATGRYNDKSYNRTLLIYTFQNGAYIEFFSADQQDKVRGPRRNILYINECNNLSFDTYHQLAIRTSDYIWLDFNPANEFWVHTELDEDPDIETLILTYQDNEALADSIVREIEKAKEKAYNDPTLTDTKELFHQANIKNYYWHNWWKVYGLGLVGELEGVIFTNWKQVDRIHPHARLLGYGMDFGFSNDPTTLVAAYQYDGRIIFDEMLYRAGMTNGDIARMLKTLGVRSNAFVVADCAEPKSIVEINQYGFSLVPGGSNAILFGIDILQEEPFYVTKRSTNLIKELRNYMWLKDKQGKSLNKPIDAYNHAIDAMRYIAEAKLSKTRQTKGGLKRRN